MQGRNYKERKSINLNVEAHRIRVVFAFNSATVQLEMGAKEG